MIKLIARKDFLLNITSPRFILGFLICLFVIPFTLIISIDKYKDQKSIYDINQKKAEDDFKNHKVYSFVRPIIVSEPKALSIFNQGINENLGSELKIKMGEYPLFFSGQANAIDNPLLNRLSSIDFSTIITIILSLFALVFSYDSFTREKENGTLTMILVNKVSRNSFIIGKLGGILLTILPILIFSYLLSIFFILLSPSIHFMASDWIGILILFLSSIIYIVVFVVLGMFISSTVKQSSTSIILSMLVWIWFLFLMPGIANYTANNFVEIGLYDNVKYALNDLNKEFKEDSRKKRLEIEAQMNENVSEHWNAWWKDDGELFTFGPATTGQFYTLFCPWEIERLIDYADKKWPIQKEYYDGLIKQEKVRQSLALLSPSEIFLQLSSSLCQTDTDAHLKHLDRIRDYRKTVINYFRSNKKFESPLWFTPFGLEQISSKKDYEELKKEYKGISLDDFPAFNYQTSATNVSNTVLYRLALLLFLCFTLLTATIIRFQKYQI